MTKRVRYSAEEVQQIIMSLPDDDESNDPDFLGEDSELDAGTVSHSSDSDSNLSEPNQIPNPGAGIARGGGRGRGPRGRGVVNIQQQFQGQGNLPHPP